MDPTPADPGGPLVLVLAPTGRDGAVTAELLRRSAMSPRVCADVVELVAGLATGADVVFVAEEARLDWPIDDLLSWVERQPAWSDMPFVMLAGRRQHSTVVAWRRRVVAALRNVSLLERPIQTMTHSARRRMVVPSISSFST